MPRSKSKSYVTTTTEQYDQRAIAESGAIAIGGGSEIHYTEEFGDNVAVAFEQLLDFAGEAGAIAAKQVSESTEALSAELERKQTIIPTAVTKTLPYVAIGFFAIAGLLILNKPVTRK